MNTDVGAHEARHTAVGSRHLDGPLLRPEQAAELLAVKTSWVYDALRGGRLPCLRIGKHVSSPARCLRTG